MKNTPVNFSWVKRRRKPRETVRQMRNTETQTRYMSNQIKQSGKSSQVTWRSWTYEILYVLTLFRVLDPFSLSCAIPSCYFCKLYTSEINICSMFSMQNLTNSDNVIVIFAYLLICFTSAVVSFRKCESSLNIADIWMTVLSISVVLKGQFTQKWKCAVNLLILRPPKL